MALTSHINAWERAQAARDGGRCPHCKRPYKRSEEQNSKMWVLLTIAAKQVEWYGARLSAEEWKDVFTAALRREKVVPGINGGFVVLGQRTSKMTKADMSELIELISAFLTERGIDIGDQQHERTNDESTGPV